MFQEHETLMMILVYVCCMAKTFSFVLLFLKKCIYGLTFSHFSSLRLCHNLRITCRASFVLIRENVATLIEFLWTWGEVTLLSTYYAFCSLLQRLSSKVLWNIFADMHSVFLRLLQLIKSFLLQFTSFIPNTTLVNIYSMYLPTMKNITNW